MKNLQFIASTENIGDIQALLKPLGTKVGNCVISEEGLQFIVEIDKILLIQTWIPSDLFSEWKFEYLEFSIDIGLLLESLNVFSLESRLEIECTSNDFVLSCNSDVFTRISLKTYDTTQFASLLSVFGDSDLLGKIILKSSSLNDVLSDMDASCTLITFAVSDSGLSISCIGSFGETEIKMHSSILDSYEFYGKVQSTSYNFSLFKHCIKALVNSKKTCIRINNEGVLSLQFMIPLLNESKFSFIEFAVISCQ